jgi:anti-anti-sigma factor
VDEGVAVSSVGDVAVVHLRGEFDLAGAARLRELLDEVLRTSPVGIIIDLSRVSYCDSACLAEFVAARRNAVHVGARLCLVGPCPLIRRILDLTGLAVVLPVYVSIDYALRRWRMADESRTTAS